MELVSFRLLADRITASPSDSIFAAPLIWMLLGRAEPDVFTTFRYSRPLLLSRVAQRKTSRSCIHLACAEAAGATHFLTCDDHLRDELFARETVETLLQAALTREPNH